MQTFIEKCVKGRYSYISKRYKKANNNDLKFYDSKHESENIIYLTNIQEWFIRFIRCLNFFQQRTRVFKLIDTKNFDSDKHSSNIQQGWVLEVDIEYPK